MLSGPRGNLSISFVMTTQLGHHFAHYHAILAAAQDRHFYPVRLRLLDLEAQGQYPLWGMDEQSGMKQSCPEAHSHLGD